MKKMNKKGFTLVEMLVVVAIIAVLAAILIPTVSTSLTKSKEAADVANVRSLYAEYKIAKVDNESTSWDTYSAKLTNLNYPDNLKTIDGKIVYSGSVEGMNFSWDE